MNAEQVKAVSPIIFYAKQVLFVGSRVTCNPAPTDTDRDILVLVEDMGNADLHATLNLDGWMLGGSGDEDDDFESWTKGEDNLILTDRKEFFDKFELATRICGALNLMDKEQRKTLFQGVLYGYAHCRAYDTANKPDYDYDEAPF